MQSLPRSTRGYLRIVSFWETFQRRANRLLRNRHSLKKVRRRCQLTQASFFTTSWITRFVRQLNETTIRTGLIWRELLACSLSELSDHAGMNPGKIMPRRVDDSWFKMHIFGLRPTLNFLGAGIESVPVVVRCRIP